MFTELATHGYIKLYTCGQDKSPPAGSPLYGTRGHSTGIGVVPQTHDLNRYRIVNTLTLISISVVTRTHQARRDHGKVTVTPTDWLTRRFATRCSGHAEQSPTYLLHELPITYVAATRHLNGFIWFKPELHISAPTDTRDPFPLDPRLLRPRVDRRWS